MQFDSKIRRFKNVTYSVRTIYNRDNVRPGNESFHYTQIGSIVEALQEGCTHFLLRTVNGTNLTITSARKFLIIQPRIVSLTNKKKKKTKENVNLVYYVTKQ